MQPGFIIKQLELSGRHTCHTMHSQNGAHAKVHHQGALKRTVLEKTDSTEVSANPQISERS